MKSVYRIHAAVVLFPIRVLAFGKNEKAVA
jgi:hypothetical protein